jgi:hypothetical protein
VFNIDGAIRFQNFYPVEGIMKVKNNHCFSTKIWLLRYIYAILRDHLPGGVLWMSSSKLLSQWDGKATKPWWSVHWVMFKIICFKES